MASPKVISERAGVRLFYKQGDASKVGIGSTMAVRETTRNDVSPLFYVSIPRIRIARVKNAKLTHRSTYQNTFF